MADKKVEDKYIDLFLNLGQSLIDYMNYQPMSEFLSDRESEEEKKFFQKKIKDRLEEMHRLEPNSTYLFSIRRKYNLSDEEIKVLAMSIAYTMYQHESGSPGGLRGKSVLDAVFSSRSEFIRKGHQLIGPSSRLVKYGLLKVDTSDAESIMDVRITPSPEFVENILGKEFFIKGKTAEGYYDRGLYVIYRPRVRLDDVVLDSQTRELIEKAIVQIRAEKIIFQEWEMDRLVGYGRGLLMLFYGPPGTGKTITAEAIAGELGMNVAYVRVDRLISAYVGETEKNIYELFREIDRHRTLLLIDEADSLLYTRESAFRSWEMREVNTLLQAIERYEGIAILTTNNEVMLDRALERRLSFKIEFRMPTRDLRRRIWERFLKTGKLPLSGDIDLDRLASYELTGGHIKNVVLNAARDAAHALVEGRKSKAVIDQKLLEYYASLEERKFRNGKRVGF